MDNRQTFIERARTTVALAEEADMPDVKRRLHRAADRWRALADTFAKQDADAENQPQNER